MSHAPQGGHPAAAWRQEAGGVSDQVSGVLNPPENCITRHLYRLAEVGRLVDARDDRYETGQLFLHRIFGYRGVILFPWTARVYDRDLHNPGKISATTTTSANPTQQNRTKEASLRVKANTSASPTAATAQSADAPTSTAFETNAAESTGTTNLGTTSQVDPKEVKGKVQTFYQVLIDTRDCPYIVRWV